MQDAQFRTPWLEKITVTHILLLGLTLRLLFLYLSPHLPISLTFGDARIYRQDGIALFHGKSMSNIYMPLYPILTYLSGGGWKQHLMDSLFSTATIGLVYLLAQHLFERKTAIIAALCTAVYPFFIFYAASALSESSTIFLLAASFYCFYKKHYFIGSIASIAGILIRPTPDLLIPFLILNFALIVHQTPWPKALRHLLLYFLLYGILMMPWWLYNYQRYHQFVRLDLNSGWVFYSGNNPLNKTGGGIEGIDVEVRKTVEHADNPVLSNEQFWKAGMEHIKTHPWQTLKLDAIKFLRFWRLWPYSPSYQSPALMALSLLSYGVMLLLALCYLCRHFCQDWRKISPMLLYIAYFTAVHSITIGSIRYRLPIEIFIIIFGAKTLKEAFAWITQRRHLPH